MSKNRWLVLAAIALLVIGTSAVSGHRLPLYDGVGFPDEPYRYVKPPDPSLKTASPPTGAEAPTNIGEDYLTLTSQETGPQVTVILDQNVFNSDQRAKGIEVKVTPLAPDNDQPTDGKLAGNIYRLSASSPLTFHPSANHLTYIDLRLPQGYPVGATVEYRQKPGGPWTSFVTTQVGNDIYEAPVIDFGDYALVVSKKSHLKNTPPKHTGLIIVTGVAVLIIATIIGIIRYKSLRGQANDK